MFFKISTHACILYDDDGRMKTPLLAQNSFLGFTCLNRFVSLFHDCFLSLANEFHLYQLLASGIIFDVAEQKGGDEMTHREEAKLIPNIVCI